MFTKIAPLVMYGFASQVQVKCFFMVTIQAWFVQSTVMAIREKRKIAQKYDICIRVFPSKAVFF